VVFVIALISNTTNGVLAGYVNGIHSPLQDVGLQGFASVPPAWPGVPSANFLFYVPGTAQYLTLATTSAGSIACDQAVFSEAVLTVVSAPLQLRAGDADEDLDFDQLDLVRVQVAGKYLTREPATWGEGDWNGGPGGSPGNPPPGDGVFDQNDIIAALATGNYLQSPYAATVPEPSSVVLMVIAAGLLGVAWRGRA
jgi:hypothetical protein